MWNLRVFPDDAQGCQCPFCCTFIHRVVFKEVSGHRVLLKSVLTPPGALSLGPTCPSLFPAIGHRTDLRNPSNTNYCPVRKRKPQKVIQSQSLRSWKPRGQEALEASGLGGQRGGPPGGTAGAGTACPRAGLVTVMARLLLPLNQKPFPGRLETRFPRSQQQCESAVTHNTAP